MDFHNHLVIPSGVEGFRCVSLKVTLRDPSTYARDDGLRGRIRANPITLTKSQSKLN